MKKLYIALSLLLLLTFNSCENDTNEIQCTKVGNELPLPKELEGLKIYRVVVKGSTVRVAVLNNEVNSLNYMNGKIHNSVIMINKTNKPIEIDSIIAETDSLIICRKIINK